MSLAPEQLAVRCVRNTMAVVAGPMLQVVRLNPASMTASGRGNVQSSNRMKRIATTLAGIISRVFRKAINRFSYAQKVQR